jgi:hypothetical protein
MKLLSKEEFDDRVRAVQRATKIFGPLTDQNITLAFQAYQEILAEQERPRQLNTVEHGERSPTIIDDLGRPKCPKCGFDMMIRQVPTNNEGVKAQFVCTNKTCDLVLDSPLSVQEIIQELKMEAERRKNAGLKQTE